jgi:hypothetical protein
MGDTGARRKRRFGRGAGFKSVVDVRRSGKSMQALLVYKKTHEEVHDRALLRLLKVLEARKDRVRTEVRPREQVRRADFLGRDLVIVLGGDGTLTSISHNIDEQTLVMGVNSHPKEDDPAGSVGFYLDSDPETFDSDLERVLEGTAIINTLPRLQAVIDTTSGNRYTTDPALNDLLVANTHQYAPSKYLVRRGSNSAVQSSSGLLFATWYGQHAWLSHAAPADELNKLRAQVTPEQRVDHCFVYARDLPQAERATAPWAHLAWTATSTVLVSDMHRGYVVPDGWDEVHFNRGATITVDAHGPALNLLTFRTTMDSKVDRLR